MKKNFSSPFASIGLWLLLSLPVMAQNQPVIAFSKASPNYEKWIHQADSSLKIMNMYALSTDSALQVLENCSALLLTGGEDVFPGLYGQEKDTSRCKGNDQQRDSLEYSLITRALERKMPILGICRGCQILNVYFGGKLFVDLPSDIGSKETHQLKTQGDAVHAIRIQPQSFLSEICGCDSGSVNSNHHQAVKSPAPGMTANANTPDGLTEGIEWTTQPAYPFLLGIQWHPERMNFENPLSGKVARQFVQAAHAYFKIQSY